MIREIEDAEMRQENYDMENKGHREGRTERLNEEARTAQIVRGETTLDNISEAFSCQVLHIYKFKLDFGDGLAFAY
jgi:hypothetical protein